jgi:Tfp pilus assembly protein FimT
MRREKGVTLVELVAGVAVAAILVSLSIPPLREQLRSATAAAETHKLLSLLARARVEAVRHNQVVTLCRSADGVACGGSWSRGWLLFVDANRNGRREEAETVLAVGRPENGYRLRLAAFGSPNRMRFSPVGFTLAGNGTFRLCPEDGDVRYARAVIVNKAGRARISRDRNGDGVHEDAQGRPLACP